MVAKFLSDEVKQCAAGIEKRKSTNLKLSPTKDIPLIFEQLLMLLVTGEREGYVRKSNYRSKKHGCRNFSETIYGAVSTHWESR